MSTSQELVEATGPAAREARRKLKRKQKKKTEKTSDFNESLPHALTSVANTVQTEGYHKAASEGDIYRELHNVSCEGDEVPTPYLNFSSCDFPVQVVHALRLAGYQAPTPIQAMVWPAAAAGRDCLAIANTGSGKTLAFAVPLIARILMQKNRAGVCVTQPASARALVLAPTRELVLQVAAEACRFASHVGVQVEAVYGGASRQEQMRALQRGADMVVATPGRLMDLLALHEGMGGETCIDMSKVAMLVLDEADRMLEMGFEKDIQKIAAVLPRPLQTMLFTATWPQSVARVAESLQERCVRIRVGAEVANKVTVNSSVRQVIRVLRQPEYKWPALLNVVLHEVAESSRALVFCNTKRAAQELHDGLWQVGYNVDSIHGDKLQEQREAALQNFKDGKVPLLVATDVAARGLHIPGVEHVINYEFPLNVQDYVHRIGRTGRAGATGIAITYFDPVRDGRHARELVKVLRAACQDVPKVLLKLASNKKRKVAAAHSVSVPKEKENKEI